MRDDRAQLRGRLLAVAAGACYGTLGTFSKLFYAHGGRPFELIVLRFGGTTLVLGALVALRGRTRPGRRFVLAGLALGAFQFGANITLLRAFEQAPAGFVVLVFYVYPLLVTLGGVLLFREEFGLHRALVLVVGLAGIALTVGTPAATPALGAVLALAGGIFTASFILGSRYLLHASTLEPVEVAALMYVLPAAGFAVAAAIGGFHVPETVAFTWAAGVVLVSSVAAMILFFAAIKAVGAGTAALLATIEPLVGVVLAYLVLGESLTALQLVGGALVLGSVASLARRGRLSRRVPAPVPDT